MIHAQNFSGRRIPPLQSGMFDVSVQTSSNPFRTKFLMPEGYGITEVSAPKVEANTSSLNTASSNATFDNMSDDAIVDAKIAAAEARTDAKFAEMMGELKASRAEFTGALQASHATLLGEIKAVGERVAGVESTLGARMGAVERATAGTKTTIIITGIAIFAAVVAAIAWGGDEFGRGSEMGQLIDSRIDAKLDHLIEVLRVPNNLPTPQR